MNIGDALREATRRLKEAGVDAPRADARIIFRHAAGSLDADLVPEQRELLSDIETKFFALIARRAAREPVAYILGKKEFWGLDFELGPGVLVPRPETEILVEQLAILFPDRHRELLLFDCGAGSGCIVVAALKMFTNAVGIGIESSKNALAWARRNLERHGLVGRCELRASDWSAGLGSGADAILANPPYIKRTDLAALAPEVARYEPTAALDGGLDGLDAFRSLAPLAKKALKPGGMALFEIGAGQAHEVRVILAEAGLRTVRIVPDLAGIPRCVVAEKAR